MKDCNECEHYIDNGYMEEPGCAVEGACPYNNVADAKALLSDEDPFHIEIDGESLVKLLRHTMENTTRVMLNDMVLQEIEKIIKQEFRQKIQSIVDAEAERQVCALVADLLEEDLVINDGWMDVKCQKRKEFFLETLKNKLDGEAIRKTAENIATKHINEFNYNLKRDINRNIEEQFNQVTRKTLSDSVVNLLMSSDTYKQLAASMSNLLPSEH